MIELFAGILTTLDVVFLLGAFLYWAAKDWFQDVPDAQAYAALVDRWIAVLKHRINPPSDKKQCPGNEHQSGRTSTLPVLNDAKNQQGRKDSKPKDFESQGRQKKQSNNKQTNQGNRNRQNIKGGQCRAY